MQDFSMLINGILALFAQPMSLLFAVLGVTLGVLLGILPGLTATMGVAILLPFTFGMDPVPALLMISGVYFGGIYGGSITAILLNIPGTPAAAATALDGYQLTRQGKAGVTLGTATLSSFVGGSISILILIFMAPLLADFALKFSAAENFALAVFGLSIIVSISSHSMLKGLIAGGIGLLIATVGLDPMSGYPRFTGGFNELMSVPFIPIMIGLFAASEAFKSLSETQVAQTSASAIGRIIPPWSSIKGLIPTILRSAGLGSFIGSIPGAGADIASFVAYNEARRFSKNKENFGKGELQGVAAAESASNGCTGGALLPMLTLGIPGDAVTAVMLGALVLQGLQPGPMLFAEHGELVFTVFAGMLFCYLVLLAVGLASLRVVVKIIRIPKAILTPTILSLCVVGTYAINNSVFDIGIMLAAGIAGYIMQKRDFPPSPIVLALIMGPMAESNFRRALSLQGGSYDFLYTRPITVVLLSIALLTLSYPIYRKLRSKSGTQGAADRAQSH
ncbi:tripartite tricarboxylate transporter permease [Marinobacterium rhizophilum]|nr:tripartite tricarboxylate transporter permease [Marinobacterium rhizophilum]